MPIPNKIKYSTTRIDGTIKAGNFILGVTDGASYGPTSQTGFYQGLSPVISGYTVYQNKATLGPATFRPNNDTEFINLTRALGGNVTGVTDSIVFLNSQSDITVVNRDYENIITDKLVLNLDAGFTPSYPRSGTTWYDVSGYGRNGTLTNGPSYSGTSGGAIIFDGVDDYITLSSQLSSLSGNSEASLCLWIKLVSGSNASGVSGLIQLSSYNNSNGNLYFYTDALRVGGIWLDIFRTDRLFTGDWAPTFDPTNWHLLTVTTTPGSNGWKMYLNGILRYQSMGQSVVSVDSSLFGGFRLGQNGGGRELRGNISICQIYSKVLSQNEITQNFNAQKSRFGL